MTSVGLGMPALPPPVLRPRRPTRQIKVGSVGVGSESPISVQSMTTTLTSDVNATLQQIAELTATGCDIVRVACPSQDDADALAEIAQHSQIPVIADIHFQPKYVFAAIDAGCAAVRVNPGNIRKFDDQVKEIAQAAKDRGTSIRIGVNAGSLDKRIMDKYGKATPEALVESAVWEAGLFEEHDFHDFKISVKHNDPVVMVRAYELLAEAGDWPLHLGVTEAGPAFQGTIKSSVAFGAPPQPGHRRHHPGLAVARRRSRRSRSASRSSSRSTSSRVASRSCRARRAVAPRSTSTSWPRRSPPASTGSRCRSGSPSWAASSTVPARPARPTSGSPPATARARSSSRARSSRPSRSRRSWRPSSRRPCASPRAWSRSRAPRPSVSVS